MKKYALFNHVTSVIAATTIATYFLGSFVLLSHLENFDIAQVTTLRLLTMAAGTHYLFFLITCLFPLFPFLKFAKNFIERERKASFFNNSLTLFRLNILEFLVQLIVSTGFYVIAYNFTLSHISYKELLSGSGIALINVLPMVVISQLAIYINAFLLFDLQILKKRTDLGKKGVLVIALSVGLAIHAVSFGRDLYKRIPSFLGGGQYRKVMLYLKDENMFTNNIKLSDGSMLTTNNISSYYIMYSDHDSYYVQVNTATAFTYVELPREQVIGVVVLK